MKKVLIALALVSVFASFRPGYAENQYFEARLGSLFPWSIQPGFLGEVAYGFRIDRMVSINVSADYYMTAFTTSTNAAPDTGIQTQGLSSELTANLIAFLQTQGSTFLSFGGILSSPTRRWAWDMKSWSTPTEAAGPTTLMSLAASG